MVLATAKGCPWADWRRDVGKGLDAPTPTIAWLEALGRADPVVDFLDLLACQSARSDTGISTSTHSGAIAWLVPVRIFSTLSFGARPANVRWVSTAAAEL